VCKNLSEAGGLRNPALSDLTSSTPLPCAFYTGTTYQRLKNYYGSVYPGLIELYASAATRSSRGHVQFTVLYNKQFFTTAQSFYKDFMATTDNIEAALAALALEVIPNIAATARQYNVGRTRLWRRFKGLTRSVAEAYEYQQLLSNTQLKVLVEHINHLSNLGIPPIISMVHVFAWEICQEWPGENWVTRFILSHKNKL
jgi:hypothetical protein